MVKVVAVALALFFLCAFVAGTKLDCKVAVDEPNKQTYVYDLCQLGDLSVSLNRYEFTLNLNDGVSSGCTDGAAVCRKKPTIGTGPEYVSLGKLETRDILPLALEPQESGNGVVVMFGKGGACGDDDKYGCSISILCDPNQRAMVTVTSEEDCFYQFSISSSSGCGHVGTSSELPDGGEGDTGETVAIVILVILLVAAVVYFVGGAIFVKVARGGADSCRGYILCNEFWCALPGLVRDGVLFICHGFKRGDYLGL